MEPTVGRIVHYVSHGSPVRADGTQAYSSVCRAAIVTEAGTSPVGITLCVLNPTGMFFSPDVWVDEEHHAGGSWHWPERA
jgi:hypothetical protein